MGWWRKGREECTTEPPPGTAIEDDEIEVAWVDCDDCRGTGDCPICTGDDPDIIASCGCDGGDCSTCVGCGEVRRAVSR